MSEGIAWNTELSYLSLIVGRTKFISEARLAKAEVTSNSSSIRAFFRMDVASRFV